MVLLPLLLFAAIAVLAWASLMKFAAFLYKRTVITWPQCFAFAGLLYVIAMINRILEVSVPSWGDASITVVLTFALVAVISVWYFAPRARTSSGDILGFKGAVALTAIYCGLLLALLALALIFYTSVSHAP